jgi:hypothetical protein
MTSSPLGSATTAAGRTLSVVADLRLETAGQRIQVVGDGQSLVLHTDHPLALLAAVNGTSLPSRNGVTGARHSVRRAADSLSRAGLRVDVRGPAGVLISLGNGAGSRSGRLLTGSRAVTFGPLREVAAGLTSGLPLGRITAASCTVLAISVAVFARSRRRR